MYAPSPRGLTALFLAASGVLVAALLALPSREGPGAERLRSDLAAAAANLADRLDQGIYERSRDVQLAAQHEVLADPAASVDAKRAVLARWHELRPEYAIAVLASPEGRIIATSNRLVEGADVSARDWFLKGRAGPAVVDVHDAVLLGRLLGTNPLNPPRFIDLVAPVRGRDGALRGVIAVHLYADWMAEVERSVRSSLGGGASRPVLSVVGAGGETLFDAGAAGGPRAEADAPSASVATLGYREYPGLGWKVVARAQAWPGEGGSAPDLMRALVLALPLAAMAFAAALLARRGPAAPAGEGARSSASPSPEPSPESLPEPAPAQLPAALPLPAVPLSAAPRAADPPATEPESPVQAASAPPRPGPEAEVGAHRERVDALRQLTEGIAHDFSNLLTIVVSNLELLRRREDLAEDHRRLVDAAFRGAERGAALTQRMLAFSHRQSTRPARTDVAELVAAMRHLISRSGLPGVELCTDFPAELEAAMVDAKQLEVALLNLVVNAQDAMQAGGTLTLAARGALVRPDDPLGLAPGRYVQVTVADEGQGMDEATLARATEPFFSTKGGGRRTGLGLAVVEDIVGRAGGALRLRSRLGEGTVAELWLPAAGAVAPFGRPGPIVLRSSRPLRVLLVDDDALVRECFAEMLGELGHRVVQAESGLQALGILADGASADGTGVDVVVTDHAMPGMTGAELAAAVAARHPHVKVVLASGHPGGVDGLTARLPSLVKPFRHAEVQAVLGALFERGTPLPEAPKVLQFRRA